MINSLSSQSFNAWKVLVAVNRPMTAPQLAVKMGIQRQNAARLLRPLVACGVVRSGRLPTEGAFVEGHGRHVYWALPRDAAHSAYIRHARREFEEIFGIAYPPPPTGPI